MTSRRQPHLEVRRITTPVDLEKAFDIRRRVFLVEQKVPQGEEFGDDDKDALHVLATIDGKAVATGRLILRAEYARVGRMAVLAEHRAHGIGRAVLQELVRAATERGVRRIVLHAQVQAIGFYQAFGFQASGEVFEEAGIPHRVMERVI